MTAKDFSELVAWQRADDLERFVLEIIKRPALARDSDYCSQAADAAASGPRNIAEGFGRFAPAQFANFLRIAIGSEVETKNQILKAWQRGAITRRRTLGGYVAVQESHRCGRGSEALPANTTSQVQREAYRSKLRTWNQVNR